MDDHRDGAETLGELLSLLGCDVRLAFTAKEALDVSPRFEPHLVILDVQMPGMSGFEVARRLRCQGWAAKSVFASHSASSDSAIADLSRVAGCQHHIAKPASVAAFEEIIATLQFAH